MSEERVSTGQSPETPERAPTATHTTIIRERESSGGRSGWLTAILVLVALVGGFYLLSQTVTVEAAKDNAVADAAQDVGSAAQQVGDAAQKAADSVAR